VSLSRGVPPMGFVWWGPPSSLQAWGSCLEMAGVDSL